MVDREVHTHSSGGGGIGVVGVIVGAILVIGAIFFFAGGPGWFAGNGGQTSVTVNTPNPPASRAPSAPAPSAPAPTTGSR
jgi:hypothetical protein